MYIYAWIISGIGQSLVLISTMLGIFECLYLSSADLFIFLCACVFCCPFFFLQTLHFSGIYYQCKTVWIRSGMTFYQSWSWSGLSANDKSSLADKELRFYILINMPWVMGTEKNRLTVIVLLISITYYIEVIILSNIKYFEIFSQKNKIHCNGKDKQFDLESDFDLVTMALLYSLYLQHWNHWPLLWRSNHS